MAAPTQTFNKGPFMGAFVSGEGIPEVSPQELSVVQMTAPVVVVDVRRPDEFTGELGHIANAQLVTLESQFKNWLSNQDKNKTYVFVCRSGGRSGSATAHALQNGFKSVFNMSGGMISWNQAKLPVSK